MNTVRMSFGLIALALLGGCNSAPTCNEPEHYQSARLGNKIAVPEGLDEPLPQRELKIPEPSAQPPQAAAAGCLDTPPKIG